MIDRLSVRVLTSCTAADDQEGHEHAICKRGWCDPSLTPSQDQLIPRLVWSVPAAVVPVPRNFHELIWAGGESRIETSLYVAQAIAALWKSFTSARLHFGVFGSIGLQCV